MRRAEAEASKEGREQGGVVLDGSEFKGIFVLAVVALITWAVIVIAAIGGLVYLVFRLLT